jgi:hypothetical protein
MADYGIKVSKVGFDVKSASDINLIMSSKFNMLKTKQTGTFSGEGTLAHGLEYTPIVLIRSKGGTLDRMNIVGNGGTDATNLTFENPTVKRYYIFYQQAI